MAPAKPVTLPVIPLAKDPVLLPGIVLRIPVAGNRPDIPALLSNVYSRAASKTHTQRLDSVNSACGPLKSPHLSQNGQKVISQDEKSSKSKERLEANPASIKKEDLFGYG